MAQGEQFQLAEGGFFNLDLRGQYEPVFPLKNLSARYMLLCNRDIVVENDRKEFTVKIPLLYE
ncbi:hypothetical protein DWW05_00215 [Bacteroides thetaiotaomicron]|nr:hypothetical protein DWW05_00215 [Bacteroides thetaiotaomicron]RHF20519.1 hypothetical protein DW697_00220 [Bacteroides thetaiotaomicron]